MEKYKTVSTLGDGAFGTVYKATNIKTGEVVAIKKMKQKYSSWNECIELRQIKSLRKLNHTSIIKLKEVLLVSEQLYMVFQYLDYNLYEVYSKMKEKGKKFTQKQIKSIVFQIAEGLAHMHKNGFFHRDMKPENLLTYNNVVKICDLGLARQIRSRPPFTDYVSTRWYRAPELLLRSTNYNSPVDVFALGCIMAELYSLSPLFAGTNEVDQLNKIVKIMGTPDKADWPEGYKLAQSKKFYFPQEKGTNLADLIPDASLQAIDLIQSMLKYSSRKRPTAIQILKHEYFQGISLPKEMSSQPKDIVFEEKPTGVKLNTTNQDKKMDEFRKTKNKFKETRKHDALENNPFNVAQKKPEKGSDLADLDSLIAQLEKKQKKKKQKTEFPTLNTKNHFNQKQQKGLRESKTEIKHGQPYHLIEKDDWKNYNSKNKEKSSYKQKEVKPPSKSQIVGNKFSYGFQPASINSINNAHMKSVNTNSVNSIGYGGLGYRPLQPKYDLKPMNIYKT